MRRHFWITGLWCMVTWQDEKQKIYRYQYSRNSPAHKGACGTGEQSIKELLWHYPAPHSFEVGEYAAERFYNEHIDPTEATAMEPQIEDEL